MASSSFTHQAPPIFDGDNYLIWFLKMKAYLGSFGLRDVVETGGEPPALAANPTIAQINQHNEDVAKPYKALSYIHSAVTDAIFTRIMTCETPKEAWDKLKEEFQGSERTRQRQILNLMREFEVLKMKDNEPVKEYIDKLILIVNQVRLLGGDMPEKRLIEKVLVSIPERFESIISFLESSKDLSKLTLTEVVDALQASEYRRAIRLDEITENALHAKEKEKKRGQFGKAQNRKSKYQSCPHCKKRNHAESNCWFRPNVKCRSCNQFGHVEIVCKNKLNP